MSCLGVLFSLDEKEVKKLKNFKSSGDRLNYVQEEIEEIYFYKYPARVAELDKAWDALHRSLTDGRLEYTNGTFPLNHVILGGEILFDHDHYIMTLKSPRQVKQIALGLKSVDEAFLKNGYNKINANEYGIPLTDDDFDYTWYWFNLSKQFWELAAKEDRYVLFTADQ